MNIYTHILRASQLELITFILEKNGYFMAINSSPCFNEIIIIPSDVKFMKLSNISLSLTL